MATGGNLDSMNPSLSLRFGALSLSQSPSQSLEAPFSVSASQHQHLGESQGQSDGQSFLQVANASFAPSSPLSAGLSSASTVSGDFQPACGTSTSPPILHAEHGSCPKSCKKRCYHAILYYHHPDDNKLACDVKAHLESIMLNHLGVKFPVRVAFLSSLTNKVDVECIGKVLENEMTKVLILLCTDSYLKNNSIGMTIINSFLKCPSSPDVIELFFDPSTMKRETTQLVRRVLYEPYTARFMDEMRTILTGTSFDEQIRHDKIRKACERRRRKELETLVKGEKKRKKTHSKKTFSMRSRRGNARAKETDLSSAASSGSAPSSDTDYQSHPTRSMKSGSQKIRHMFGKLVNPRHHLKLKTNDSSDETSLPSSQTAGSETMTVGSGYRGDVSCIVVSASDDGDTTDRICELEAIRTGSSQEQLTAGIHRSSETTANGMPTQQPTSSVYHSHQMEGAIRSDHEQDLHQTVPKTFATKELTLFRDGSDESAYNENASSGSELNRSEQPVESDNTHKVIFARFQGAASNNLAPYADEGFNENTHKRLNCHPREKSSARSAQSHLHSELSESCSDSASEQRGNRSHKRIKSSDEELNESTPCFNDLMTSSPSDEEQDADDKAVTCQMSDSRGTAARTKTTEKNPTLTRETDLRKKPRAVVTPMTQNREDSDDDDESTMRKTVCTVDRPAHASNVNRTPHTSNVSMTPHTSNVSMTPHTSNVSMTPHTSNVSMTPHTSNVMTTHISNVSTTPHTSNINQPQTSNVEPTPQASNINTMLHTSNVNTTLHTSNINTTPHTSVVNLPHSSDTNTTPNASNVNTALHTSNVNTELHTSNVNTAPHTSNVNTTPHTSVVNLPHSSDTNTMSHASNANTKSHTSNINTTPHTTNVSPGNHSSESSEALLQDHDVPQPSASTGGLQYTSAHHLPAISDTEATSVSAVACRMNVGAREEHGTEAGSQESAEGKENGANRPVPTRYLPLAECGAQRRPTQCNAAKDGPEVLTEEESQDEGESQRSLSRLLSRFSCSTSRSRSVPRRAEHSAARGDPGLLTDEDSQDEGESGGLMQRLWSRFSCSSGRSRRRPHRKRKN